MTFLIAFSSGLFFQGLLAGLLLTVMTGPVTLMILRYGVIVDHRAGLIVALGTWVSDIVFILPTYLLTEGLEHWLEQSGTKTGLFVAGGLGLILTGFLLIRKTIQGELTPSGWARRHYRQAFLAGFLVNSLSAFTLFFWLGVAVFLRAGEGWPGWFYTSLMMSLMGGDIAKAWIAPRLARRIAAHRYRWLEVGSGVAVILAGIYVMIQGILGR